MKTTDYLKLKYELDLSQPVVQIPNVGRLDIIRWLRELQFTKAVEVGVAMGEFAKLIVEGNPQLKLWGVDPWIAYDEYGDYQRPSTFNYMLEHAHRVLDPYAAKDRFVFVQQFSTDALSEFADNSLDFVYIDGNHQAPFVDQDIAGWWPKISPGGILAGHDYSRINRVNWGVKEAVHHHAAEYGLPLLILGTDKVLPNQVRDGSRSWAFIK